MSSKKHDWKREQPHHASNGKIVSKKFAEKNPTKVEWVKVKKAK